MTEFVTEKHRQIINTVLTDMENMTMAQIGKKYGMRYPEHLKSGLKQLGVPMPSQYTYVPPMVNSREFVINYMKSASKDELKQIFAQM